MTKGELEGCGVSAAEQRGEERLEGGGLGLGNGVQEEKPP